MNERFVKYAIRRVIWTLPVLVLSTAFIFSLIHIMPGSPAETLLSPEFATEKNIALMNEMYGLNQPVWKQYLSWVWGLLHGDMGTSILENRPVSEPIFIATKRTFLVGIWAAILGIVVAIPIGIIGAVYKDTWVDDITRVGAIGGISMPDFWLALLVIMIFAQIWNNTFGSPLIPASGYEPISNGVVGWARHSVGPAVVLAVPYGAVLSRVTRASMVDVLNEEYITTARSKGVKEWTIISIHSFKNALIPVITVGAYQAASIFNGSVLVETVFSYPGLGWYVYRAALTQDFPLLMGAMVVIVTVYIGLNMLADLAYGWVDPRIDYGSISE